VPIVHHGSRGGNDRGTSKREDVLDTIVQLKHPIDHSPADGAKFEAHLTKVRKVIRDDATPFEARLEVDEERRSGYVYSDIEGTDADDAHAVLDMSEAGKSVRDIPTELKVAKSTVRRMLKRARNRGSLPRAKSDRSEQLSQALGVGTVGHLVGGNPKSPKTI
jgi:hypothetical protein